jgi:WG containing repeat
MKIIKQCCVVDDNNNVIVPLGYDNIEICGEKFKVLLNEKWGLFCSEKKQLIVNCNYDSIKFGLYSLGIECYIVEKENKFGVFSVVDDRFIANCEYDEIIIDNDYLMRIRQSSKWGSIDFEGDIIFSIENDEIILDYGVKVRKGNLCGLYTYEGYALIPKEKGFEDFQEIKGFGNDAFVKVFKNGKCGLFYNYGVEYRGNSQRGYFYNYRRGVDDYGNSQMCYGITVQFDEIEVINGEECLVKQENLFGVFTKEGNIIVPCEFDEITYSNNIFEVRKGEIIEFIEAPLRGDSCYIDMAEIYNEMSYGGRNYSRYNGGVTGDLTDDFIDDVLDGNPDAYWNID